VSAVVVAVTEAQFDVLETEDLTPVVEFLIGYTVNVLDRLGKYYPKIECQ
jgi:hypothetical protein